MHIWSKLISLILVLVFAAGLFVAWQVLRAASLADLGWRMLALLAGACIVPAAGLLVWLQTRAEAQSAVANIFLVVAALAGAASSAVVVLVILASDI